ncbi:MAG TPA: hypothetical protein VJH23_03025 [archaeon]|nr:hypothetical protein [archaeon]
MPGKKRVDIHFGFRETKTGKVDSGFGIKSIPKHLAEKMAQEVGKRGNAYPGVQARIAIMPSGATGYTKALAENWPSFLGPKKKKKK